MPAIGYRTFLGHLQLFSWAWYILFLPMPLPTSSSIASSAHPIQFRIQPVTILCQDLCYIIHHKFPSHRAWIVRRRRWQWRAAARQLIIASDTLWWEPARTFPLVQLSEKGYTCSPEKRQHKDRIFKLPSHGQWCTRRLVPWIHLHIPRFHSLLNNQSVVGLTASATSPVSMRTSPTQHPLPKTPNSQHTYPMIALSYQLPSLSNLLSRVGLAHLISHQNISKW